VRAIVTGGAGFIGSHLFDALVARGDGVTVLDNLRTGRRERVNEGAELVVGDIRDGDFMEHVFAAAAPDVCFHLAAQADVRVSVEDPLLDCDVNVAGTLRLLEQARAHGARIVFASTGGAIYGECQGPADEDAPRQPLAPYGVSKLAAEEYLAMYNRLHGTAHVSMRYGNVYGPRQDPHGEAGVVAIFFGRLARAENLRVFGDGRQTRDYVYVKDVARANILASTAAPPTGDAVDGPALNIGTSRQRSVLELAEAVGEAVGRAPQLEFAPARPGELSRSVLDAGKAREALGWTPECGFDQGLRELVDWFRQEAR
jgi:UDP-glucose 4-epimerase